MTPFEQGQPPWWRQAVRESLGDRPVLPPLSPPLAELPPLPLGDNCLNDEQRGELLITLRKSSLNSPLTLIGEVKRHFAPGALDAFAWRAFELCLATGQTPEIKLGLGAVGLLGGDACALKLTPFLRDWPGQGFSQRATWGLEALRAIGSETALMQLNGIAQKVKSPALQKRARQLMGEIAAQRGLSQQQLEDRIVPDLGLDERGGRSFDYGPRQFRLVFGPNLKPMLRDEQGKTKSGLPRAVASDDTAKVEEAARDWKLLKKQVSETVKVQAKRLERAMVARRRWSRADFEKYLVRHPFLTHMTRLLLWGDCRDNGELIAAFRVTEDGTFADADDRPHTPSGTKVGLVHPLALSEEQRAKWGEVFADYEIIPPFPQLGRRIHTLRPGEEEQTELTRFGGKAIPSIVFQGILKQQGWLPARWTAGYGYYKRYPEADLTALMQIDYAHGDAVTIPRAFFVSGFPDTAAGRLDVGAALRLGGVEAVTLSEMLGVLEVLASKGT
jgi:hypothetical protein